MREATTEQPASTTEPPDTTPTEPPDLAVTIFQDDLAPPSSALSLAKSKNQYDNPSRTIIVLGKF